jgi:hypothetical protein
MIENLNVMVAEKGLFDHFNCEKLLGAIINTFSANEACMKKLTTMPKGYFAGLGEWDLRKIQPKLTKLTMTHYTYEDFNGKQKAYILDGQKIGLFDVIEFTENDIAGFLQFHKANHREISWEQSAAVYWAKVSDCCLVSESDQVLELAQSNGVPTLSIEEMGKLLFKTSETMSVNQPTTQPCKVCPFDPRVDEEKVAAAFSTLIEKDEGMVLKRKSYWIVVCVLFEWYQWLSLRKRSKFREWVNAHFHFDSPLTDIDFKSALKNIAIGEKKLSKWPNNKYRDLAYTISQLFFGEREGLPNGYYVYANEAQYLKPGRMIQHRNE